MDSNANVGRATALLSDDLVRGATGDIKPILSGKFEHSVETTEMVFPIKVMDIMIGDTAYHLSPEFAGTAIAMTLFAN